MCSTLTQLIRSCKPILIVSVGWLFIEMSNSELLLNLDDEMRSRELILSDIKMPICEKTTST